jgi:hypothetical protein
MEDKSCYYIVGYHKQNEDDDSRFGRFTQSELLKFISCGVNKIYIIEKCRPNIKTIASSERDIILYTSDVSLAGDSYIGNYESLPGMYGINPLDDIDKKIIHFMCDHKQLD